MPIVDSVPTVDPYGLHAHEGPLTHYTILRSYLTSYNLAKAFWRRSIEPFPLVRHDQTSGRTLQGRLSHVRDGREHHCECASAMPALEWLQVAASSIPNFCPLGPSSHGRRSGSSLDDWGNCHWQCVAGQLGYTNWPVMLVNGTFYASTIYRTRSLRLQTRRYHQCNHLYSECIGTAIIQDWRQVLYFLDNVNW